jgi:hypothetical protein
MSIENFTRTRCPELADFLAGCCIQPLAFEGAYPLMHSSHNHTHLWALEYWADHHAWIDLDYRVAFVRFIFERWRGRLKGLEPYRQSGYRLYLYEDMAPTISVVADTPYGFPYGGTPHFVKDVREIMALYVGRSWRQNFSGEPWELKADHILAAVEQHSGSISKPTATALGVPVGKLRILIEQMGLENRVNAIRKKFKRRPAAFRADAPFDHRFKIYEQRLPAGYR